MSYTNFQVGEKFPLPIRAQGEGGIFQYDRNGAMFILKLSRSDLIAIEAFRTGKIEIGLFSQDNILFFLYKIDGIFAAWGDCPYALQFHAESQRPDLSKPQDKTLNLYLVESNLDILLAMRSAALDDAFHSQLMRLIREQLEQPFDQAAYIPAVQAVWQQYTPAQMAENAVARQTLPFSLTPPAPRGEAVN